MKFRLSWLLLVVLTSACAPAGGYGEILERPSGHPAATVPLTTPPRPAPRDLPAETHTGKGSGEFTTSWPADQLGFFTFDCPKCSGNVLIDTDGGEDGLVNAIGAYKGTTWLNTYPDRPTRTVTIRATAAWTATIADHRSLTTAESGKPAKGTGDAVLKLPAGVTRVQFAAKTPNNVALWVISPEKRDLLVNEIGDTQVECDVRGPALLRVDGYEASWTLTPS
ncbi:hypothetical protein DMA12_02435 [Amycolatopsis balhimycina DSM 5908]|uniref:Lipoprotein n=1 Tax=Amycolatopsis balhimycina DSM 5908 TaxID=1081091 RepID=A0A428X474_AMYBA|nr:hypothetical protein [Amycolatopsis balhimycina]RSM50131.1 hypothetical protein DMA12_02435 [Amycolatopsis balhimycina DSM 5908]